MKKTILFFWAFVMLLSISMKAQLSLVPTVISSSGDFYSGGNITISFTVAEMTMVETFAQPNSILTQGFQQEFPPFVSIEENNIVGDEVNIFPNPTTGQFSICFKNNKYGEDLVRIYNMVGQIVFTQSYTAGIGMNTIKVDIGQYRQGVYMLELTSNINGKMKSSIHKINLVY